MKIILEFSHTYHSFISLSLDLCTTTHPLYFYIPLCVTKSTLHAQLYTVTSPTLATVLEVPDITALCMSPQKRKQIVCTSNKIIINETTTKPNYNCTI